MRRCVTPRSRRSLEHPVYRSRVWVFNRRNPDMVDELVSHGAAAAECGSTAAELLHDEVVIGIWCWHRAAFRPLDAPVASDQRFFVPRCSFGCSELR